jgi:hypothetical protein
VQGEVVRIAELTCKDVAEGRPACGRGLHVGVNGPVDRIELDPAARTRT